MLYIAIDENGHATGYATDHNLFEVGTQYLTRHDIKDWDHAVALAKSLTEDVGGCWLAVDRGQWVSPRFDVIVAPAVGDVVSKSFNGDSYPVGKIARISKTMKKITTDDGQTFYRHRLSGAWTDGTFTLIPGVHNERNPHI